MAGENRHNSVCQQPTHVNPRGDALMLAACVWQPLESWHVRVDGDW